MIEDRINSIKLQLEEKIARLNQLSDLGQPTADLEADIEKVRQVLASLQQIRDQGAALSLIDNLPDSLLDGIPDIDIQLPSISMADIREMLPSLPSLPDFPPRVSINSKVLLKPVLGIGSPQIPDIPPIFLQLLKIVPAEAGKSTGPLVGPNGGFTAGTSVMQNIVATDTIHAPDVSVEKMITVPTLVVGNIASTGILSIASPTLTVLSPAATFAGTLSAAVKLFDIPHPQNPHKRLRHGSLEGPEYGVYFRGKAESGIIIPPSYWNELVDPLSITVHVTPTHASQSLIVRTVSVREIHIEGHADLPFYYMVIAERKDISKLEVETYA